MSSSLNDAVSRLASQSDAVGKLAQDSGGFSAVVAAFESKDANAFRWVLDRLEMLPYCELICEWVRIKLGVLRCIEVCGLPREKAEPPSVQEFAGALVRLASNEKLLRRVVDAVSCGDGDDYRAAIAELELEEFCYLICHWVYFFVYYRVCEIVCSPNRAFLPDAASEIRAAAEEIAGVLKNKRAIAAIGEAARTSDCLTLKSTLAAEGFSTQCEIICWLICSWRCVWVCWELCVLRSPVFNGEYGVEEARSFALAARQLAGHPRALGDLVSAVQNRDAKAYSEIVSRYGLSAYCFQLCAWLCSVTCREFCICLCPPPGYPPIFKQVGNFEIYGEIDPTTGLTSTAQPLSIEMPYGGGPNFAFYEQLQLGGFCPITSPTHPGVQMMYRFFYSTVVTSLASNINATQTTINVAPGAAVPATPFNVSVCNDGSPNTNETAEIMTVTGVAGTTWTVVRHQEGSIAASAPAGAPVGLNPTAITGNLVSPVQVGTRPYLSPWPTNLAGLAGPLATGWSEAVMIVPPNYQPPYPSPNPGTVPPDLGPPAGGTTWYPPVHYITPDANGWVAVDENLIVPGVTVLLGFDTTQPGVAPGGDPLPGAAVAIGTPGGVPAGTAVPAASQKVGVDLSIIFQATRVGVATVDYSNSLCRVHVNNWSEVNNLWFQEFGSDCCNPIDETLSVQFTVDHETMAAGAWSLAITSCSPSAPGNITPPDPTAGVTFTAGGRGASGTIVENTSTWTNCSYTGALSTRPGLTTGLYDDRGDTVLLTFCICGN
jgi:hypothetical protein